MLRNNRLKKLDSSFPIVVTSYEIIMRDRRFLQVSVWSYVIETVCIIVLSRCGFYEMMVTY
jgi:hypothetical protein